jgi:hypothetical protein
MRGGERRDLGPHLVDATARLRGRGKHPSVGCRVLRQLALQLVAVSLALACAGGLVPEVTDVVSNAVSFHVDVPRLSKLKLHALVPVLGFGYRTIDEFVARLESDDPLMPRLIPSVMRRLEAAEARALAQAERAEYEQLGRSVVETLQRYAHIGRR